MESNSFFDTVSLKHIDFDDQRFRISTSGPDGPLVASIEQDGVITPPVLLKQGSSYIIISGFKRAMACRQLGFEQIVARIFVKHTAFEECVRVAIIENVFLRVLNFVEQGKVVQLLDQLYPDQAQLCQEANRLGISLNSKIVKKLRMVSHMHPDLQNALIEGHIALPILMQLDEMNDDVTAIKICKIFGAIGLGLNRQREFMDWLIGISHRERIPIAELVDDRKLEAILSDTETDRKQKSFQARRYFKTRRFPEISKAEQRYNDFIRTLKLGKGLQLIPPAHFEGQTYTIKIDFTQHEELVSRFKILEKTIDASALKQLWEIFGAR